MLIICLAMVLMAGACAAAAVLLERDGRPGWSWSWTALLLSGAVLNTGIEGPVPNALSLALGSLFAPLTLRAAFQHAFRPAPAWILPLAAGLAFGVAVLDLLAPPAAPLLFALLTAPALLVWAVRLALRAPESTRHALAGRYVAPSLCVLVGAEALHLLFSWLGGSVPYAMWLLVSVPTGTVQLVSSVSGANRTREQALRASEERFRQFAAGSRDTFVEVDAEGRVTYVSPNVRQQLGFDPDTIIGRKLPEVLASLEAQWPDALVSEASSRAALAKSRLSGSTHRLRDANGSWHWLETHASAYRAANGELRVLGLSRDITERVETEHALRASDERLREILSSLPDTRVALMDREGRLRRIFGDESARQYGVSRDDVVGELGASFVSEQEARAGLATLQEVFETGEPRRLREEVSLPTGDHVWDVTLSPLREASGEVGLVIVVARDVSEQVVAAEEQRKLEAQLHQAQKRESLGVLAGGIAHDFNNLLVGVLGNAALALEQAPEDSPLRESLQEIVLSAERASELTHQLVAYTGDASFEVDAVDLSSLLQEIARLLRAAVPKSAKLSIGAEDGIWVQGDSTQLQQVMMNLITNASESLEGGLGTVRLRTGVMHADADYLAECQLAEGLTPGEYAYFEVVDDGVGIDPELLPRIFDPFVTTKFHGRGLGLAATLGIVRGHGGALRVESEPDSGTTVRVLLPPAPQRETSPDAGTAVREIRELRGTVLAVDDQPHVLRLAQRMLARLGLVGLTAQGGPEALRIFRERCHEIDAVLLDLTMPEMNGEQVFRALRGIRPDVPVVLMSGHSEQRIAKRLAGEGRVSRLHKPFQLAALAARLEDALASGVGPGREAGTAAPEPPA